MHLGDGFEYAQRQTGAKRNSKLNRTIQCTDLTQTCIIQTQSSSAVQTALRNEHLTFAWLTLSSLLIVVVNVIVYFCLFLKRVPIFAYFSLVAHAKHTIQLRCIGACKQRASPTFLNKLTLHTQSVSQSVNLWFVLGRSFAYNVAKCFYSQIEILERRTV